LPGQDVCPRCGIRLIDISRHHWGYDAKEVLLDALDSAGEKARAMWREPEARRFAVRAGQVVALAGAAIVGFRLLRKRRV
jgi:hypothetical protein